MTDDGEQYPRGKLTALDEGALEVRIGIHERTVIMDFRKGVTWIGLDLASARAIAASILQKADEIEAEIAAAGAAAGNDP